MVCNAAMERLLTNVYRNGVTPYFSQRIWKRETLDGNPFWGIGNFCGISTERIIQYGRELTDLEWEGNELFFSGESPENIKKNVIAAYLFLKKQMEEEFSDWEFDLVVSIDERNGTGTIRFYGIRDGYHYIEPAKDKIFGYEEEAILVDTVNEAHLEKYLPLLEETLKDRAGEIQSPEKNIVRISSADSENCMEIYWDEEFTMCFDCFHSHYGEENWDELVETVKQILSGNLVVCRIESMGRWLGSFLLEPGTIPVTSKSRLLKFLFAGQKDFRREVNEYGGVFSITSWNKNDSRVYRIAEDGIKLIEGSDKPWKAT